MRRLPLRSPPRVRGKVWLHQKPGRVPGITPAYAGKSPPAKRKNPAIWDHPRVCGEKRLMLLVFRAVTGSPPRMRGKVLHPEVLCDFDGITPAYAGKSDVPVAICAMLEDHPRVCGEKEPQCYEDLAGLGSPPRMRGKVCESQGARHDGGSIPAHAGKSIFLYRCVVLCYILFRAIRQSTP